MGSLKSMTTSIMLKKSTTRAWQKQRRHDCVRKIGRKDGNWDCDEHCNLCVWTVQINFQEKMCFLNLYNRLIG